MGSVFVCREGGKTLVCPAKFKASAAPDEPVETLQDNAVGAGDSQPTAVLGQPVKAKTTRSFAFARGPLAEVPPELGPT